MGQSLLAIGNPFGRGWLGVEVASNSLEEAFRKRLIGTSLSNNVDWIGMGAFVTTVAVNLPLLLDQDRTINATSLFNDNNIKLGDRIMNVGGNDNANGAELANEMKKRVEGEQITLTVENLEGNKKVVYVTLGRIPLG